MARSFGTTGQPMHIYVSGESDLDESGSGSTGPESGSTVFEWTYTCDCSTAEQTTRGVQNHFFESTGEHGSRACYECSGPRCDTCTIVVPEGMSGAAIWGSLSVVFWLPVLFVVAAVLWLTNSARVNMQ